MRVCEDAARVEVSGCRERGSEGGRRTQGGQEDARSEEVERGEEVTGEGVGVDDAAPDVEGIVSIVGEEEGMGDAAMTASSDLDRANVPGWTHVNWEMVQHMPARVRRVRRMRLRRVSEAREREERTDLGEPTRERMEVLTTRGLSVTGARNTAEKAVK